MAISFLIIDIWAIKYLKEIFQDPKTDIRWLKQKFSLFLNDLKPLYELDSRINIYF